MIQLGPCEIASAFGPVASGKTYLIDRWLESQNRYVRFDVTGETIDSPGVEHIWYSPLALHERINDEKRKHFFRIAYHPGNNLEEDFYECLRVLWRGPRNVTLPKAPPIQRTLVCDEIHEICPVYETPAYVRTMLRYARHNQLAIIGASQRIADVSKLFTASCRMTVLYWTQEARDLAAIQDRWGTSTANAVRNLRPLIYNDVTKTVKQIPQCVVCTKLSKPYIFDFQTEKELTIDNQSSKLPAAADSEVSPSIASGESESDLPPARETASRNNAESLNGTDERGQQDRPTGSN